MPTIPTTSTAVKSALAADKAAKLIPTGKQLLGGGAKFGGAISVPAAAGAAAILGVTEGLFPRSTVSEADEQRAIREAEAKKKEKSNPNLDYPSSRQVIGQTVLPSRTEQGYGDVVGAQYQYLIELDRNTADSNPPVQYWIDINSSYRAPLQVTSVECGGVTGFPEISVYNDRRVIIIRGMATDASTGQTVEFADNSSYYSGLYDPTTVKFLNLRPRNGQPAPAVITETITEATTTFPSVQPLPESDWARVTAPTNKLLAQALKKLIDAGTINDALVNPEVEKELDRLLASTNSINRSVVPNGVVTSEKTNVIDNLDNNDGYATAYSQGYGDGFSALLEKDKLDAQNKANNLDVVIPKASTKEKQNPTAVTATAKTATQEKVKEPTTSTKYYVAGKTPVKETIVIDKNTGVKTTTKAIASTGKVVSISRTVPAGLKVVNTSVDNDPLAKAKAGTTFPVRKVLGVGTSLPVNNQAPATQAPTIIGTPTKTGAGVTTIPQVPTVEQTPAASYCFSIYVLA